MASGEIGGPLIAGLLVATAGAGWALGIDAATFALSAALLARLRAPAAAAPRESGFIGDVREGWRAFRSRTWVWAVVAVASLENLFWGAWTALGAVVAERHLGGAGAWGTVLAGMGAGGVLGGVVAMRTAPRRPLVVFSVTGAVFALPLALLATTPPLALLVLAAVAAGAALMLGNAIWESTLQRHVPAAELSRVSAYDLLGSSLFRPLGLAVWGPLAVAIGTGAALWLAFAMLTTTTLSLLLIRAVRELPAQPTT
jgi:hypothetical protein